MSKIKRAIAMLLCLVMIYGIIGIGRNGFADLVSKVFVRASAEMCEVGDTIEFGSYPQSEVKEASLISSLNQLPKTWISYQYASGKGVSQYGSAFLSDFMKFCDVSFNGIKYRGVIFDSYRPSNVNDPTAREKQYYNQVFYQEKNGYIYDTIYWFKYEPIKWRVLDPASGLVFSEMILDAQPFVNSLYHVYGPEENFSDAEHTKPASNYEYSWIRTWLNLDQSYGFLGSAFTSDEISGINITQLDNRSYNTLLGKTGSEELDSSTNDKVFLLSLDEAIKEDYGFEGGENFSDLNRVSYGTDYAKVQGLSAYDFSYTSVYNSSGISKWYLRTPSGYDNRSLTVLPRGKITYDGWVMHTDIGVRPAICLSNLSSYTVPVDKQSVFNESTYIADIWLNRHGAEETVESKLINDMMTYYSPSSEMYLDLQDDGWFQGAVAGWNTFNFTFDPAGSAKKFNNVSDIYETLILTMLEKASENCTTEANNAITDAIDHLGTAADNYTEYKGMVDDLDTVIKNGIISIDTLRNWHKTSEGYKIKDFIKSFDVSKRFTKSPWSDNDFFEGIGIIAESVSDVNDFYKRLCSYMYAYDMQADMVNFLMEMKKQGLPEHFRLALNNVLNAVGNINYASVICSMELTQDLGFDVLKAVWKDIANAFPVYGFLKTVGDAAMAFSNLFMNTQEIVDKYFLLEATYNFFNAVKIVIKNSKQEYLSSNAEIDAAAYVFAMRNFQYAYEIDLESAVAFAKAADDEGVINGLRKGGKLLSSLVTGEVEKTDYQKMSDSANSIKNSLESLFYTLDTTWKFNPEYLKKDFPSVYPVYVQEELSQAIYTPLITDKYLSQDGSSNIEWAIPFYYRDKDGNIHNMSSYIIDGVEATESANGTVTSKDVIWGNGNGYVITYHNDSVFTFFPKSYSVKGYTSTANGKVYTQTRTELFESPLKQPQIGVPRAAQMLSNYNAGKAAIGIFDQTESRYDHLKYKIYRKTATTSWKLVGTVSRDSESLARWTTFVDTTANQKENYYYKVSSYVDFDNGKRVESPASEVVCLNVSDVVDNALNLVVSSISSITGGAKTSGKPAKARAISSVNNSSGVLLNWNNMDGADGYEIYRLATYGTRYKLIGTVNAETSSFFDENVIDGITYDYVVIPYTSKNGTKSFNPYNNGNCSHTFVNSENPESPDGKCGDNVFWRFAEDTGTLFISGNGAMYDYEAFSFDGEDEYAPWRKHDFSGTITSVVIESGVTTVGECAFSDIETITSVSLSSTITSIGGWVFDGCESLAEIHLPASLKVIGPQAFSECSFSEITLPKNLEDVGRFCFEYCNNLTAIKVEAGNQNYCSENGVLYNKDQTVLVRYPIGNPATTYTVNSNTTEVGDCAFENAANLREVVLPNGIKTLGWCAFSECKKLAKMDLPDSITAIGAYAFGWCAFEQVTIPQGVKELKTLLFRNNTKLKSVVLPEGLETIDSLFSGCTALETVIIPSSVKEIEYASFRDCKSLKQILLPTGLTKIDSYAFNNCSKLESIFIPQALNKIEYHAFEGCASLADAYYQGTQEQWNQISIGIKNDELLNARLHLQVTGVLSYDANGGTDAPVFQTGNGNITLSSAVPTRDGYTFKNWNTKADGTGTNYVPGASYTLSGIETLFAVWTQNAPTQYTLTYNANGGSVSPTSVSVEAGKSTTLPTPTKTVRITYNANRGSGAPSAQTVLLNCAGWATSSTATAANYRCGASFKPTANTTLYAVWSKASVTLSNTQPTRSGYAFKGWALTADATTAKYQPGGTMNLYENTTLYAVWQKNDTPPAAQPTIVIKNYTASKSVDYKTTITFTAVVTDAPTGATIQWFVNGAKAETGETCTVKEATSDYTVQCKLIGSDGSVLAESEVETVKVSNGFFARLIAFFRSLFGSLPVITQAIKETL